MLDELMTQPIAQGDIFANANTIILMGRTRHDGRYGRALAIPKHRGSACGDEILPYRITEQGLVLSAESTMSISIDLSGSTALVTGASQGIGAAIARTLHRAGARVVVNHPDVTGGKIAQDAQRLVDELNLVRGDSAMVSVADVSDPAAVRGDDEKRPRGMGWDRHPGQ